MWKFKYYDLRSQNEIFSQDKEIPDSARYAKMGNMAISLNISQNGRIWRNLIADLKLLCNPKSQICVDLAGYGKIWQDLVGSGKIWLWNENFLFLSNKDLHNKDPGFLYYLLDLPLLIYPATNGQQLTANGLSLYKSSGSNLLSTYQRYYRDAWL